MPRKELAYLDDRDHSRDNLGCDVGAGPCVRTITESENKIYNDEILAHSGVAERIWIRNLVLFSPEDPEPRVSFFPALGSWIKSMFSQEPSKHFSALVNFFVN
jgi:hypothetical protein